MSIIQKRFQQGIFEALASQNRAAGSGGGSGFQIFQFFGGAQDVNADTITATSYTVIPGVTVTFPVPRAMFVAITVSSISKISGAGGFGLMHPFFDGTDQGIPIGLWDPANTGYLNASWFAVIGGSGFTPAPFQPGDHTIDVRLKMTGAGPTWTNDVTTLQVYGLGF